MKEIKKVWNEFWKSFKQITGIFWVKFRKNVRRKYGTKVKFGKTVEKFLINKEEFLKNFCKNDLRNLRIPWTHAEKL